MPGLPHGQSRRVGHGLNAAFAPVSYTHLDVYKRQAVLQPTRLVEGNVGQQINGRFKDIEGSVCAVFVKTVFYLAALYICLLYTSRCV